MKFKKISTRIIMIILPVMIITQGILTIISAISSSTLVSEEVQKRMRNKLELSAEEIQGQLSKVETMAETIAAMTAQSYKTSKPSDYETILGGIIQTNDIVLGSGLWFEPYAYDPNEKYFGPYIYKDGNSIVTTYDYSNAEYDYFVQEYYVNAMNADGPVITNPYYDETSGVIMSSCSTPIIVDGKKIGCVTVDIELSSLDALISRVDVDNSGYAVLTDNTGVYIAGVESEKIASAQNILDDANASFASASQNIISNEEGVVAFKEGKQEFNIYYATIPGVEWKVIIVLSSYIIKRPVLVLVNRLIGVCIAGVVVAALIIILQIGGIARSIIVVQQFAQKLSSGNFTIEKLKINGNDELANMSFSLNEMYESNRDIISNISDKSIEIKKSSNELGNAASDMNVEFKNISKYMSDVNEAMMTSSAATQELNASVEQVDHSVEVLAEEIGKSLQMAKDIKNRADEIGRSSQNSFDKATQLNISFTKNLSESIAQSKVVENIGEMANIISDIASQITLLSLNASIEAARAGDQGKGFAVVATEIGKLANETAQAVNSIQATIEEVQDTFENLANNANGLLGFVSDTVTPDYQEFVNIASQYGQDAEDIASFSEKIERMSSDMKEIMEEITHAIQNIAESTQSTADISATIMGSIEDMSSVVTNVSDMAQGQQVISEELEQVVSNFVLNEK